MNVTASLDTGGGCVPERTNRPNLVSLFIGAARLLGEKPLILIPAIIPSVWAFVAPLAGLVDSSAVLSLSYANLGPAVWRLLGYLLVYIVLLTLSQGATVALVRDAARGERVSLAGGFGEAFARLAPLLAASLAEGVVILAVSLIHYVLGLVAAFFFWFVVQSVVIDSESILGALRGSFRLSATHAGETFLIILATLVLSLVLGWVPILGALLMIPVTAYSVALGTLFYMGRET